MKHFRHQIPACLLYLRSEAVAAGSQGLHTSLVPRQYPVPGSRVVFQLKI